MGRGMLTGSFSAEGLSAQQLRMHPRMQAWQEVHFSFLLCGLDFDAESLYDADVKLRSSVAMTA